MDEPVAIARRGEDSDVEVWHSGEWWFCLTCTVARESGHHFTTATTAGAMVQHLHTHRAQGDRVPDPALGRLT